MTFAVGDAVKLSAGFHRTRALTNSTVGRIVAVTDGIHPLADVEWAPGDVQRSLPVVFLEPVVVEQGSVR